MIRVQHECFDVGAEQATLVAQRNDIGAVVCFTGLVRDFNERPDVTALSLEHYPGMTESALARSSPRPDAAGRSMAYGSYTVSADWNRATRSCWLRLPAPIDRRHSMPVYS